MRAALAAGLFLCSSAALAQEGAPAVADVATASAIGPPDRQTLAGQLGFGAIGEDVFATLALRLDFDREMWGFGIGLPLRIRIVDLDPKNDEDIAGILRKEDWDEFSDFLKILRYVYVGNKNELFYARLGELSGLTVGHGTIVNDYYNGFDLDRWRVGTNIAVNIDPFGAEIVVGDLAHLSDPALVGARATVKPLQLALGDDGGYLADRLSIGATVMSDPTVPFELKKDPATGALVLDDQAHPVVEADRTLVVTGVDIGIRLLDEPLTITPYADFNVMSVVDGGMGLHLGVLWELGMPLGVDKLIAKLRTEYRRVSGDYVGPYFDVAYEIERYELPAGGKVPKLRALADGNLPGRNGYYFALLAGLPAWVLVRGDFIDYDGGQNDGTLRLGLDVPALEAFKLSAFYYRVGIGGARDLFKIDDRSAIVARASIPVYYVFALELQFRRLWKADPAEGGSYRAVDDWSVGVGFSLDL
ncbi:MAG: hypothetical protein HYV07_01145 [Deltaproteobacteria bacterium]|nr:hypothetical protein [Deltaproteobacteria bacterium]